MLKAWFEGVKLCRNDLRDGNKNYFKLAEGSNYQGFELPRLNYSECMKEIQGKSILVQVSGRFELWESTVITSVTCFKCTNFVHLL